jgi:hypothetical protein
MVNQKHPMFDSYNSNPEQIILEVRTYLENRQFDNYDNVAGLCNSILSKNHYDSNFLFYFLESKRFLFSWYYLFLNTFLFFFNTIKTLVYESLLIMTIKCHPDTREIAKFFVISFFNYDKKEKSIFDDLYLSGLQRELIKRKIPYNFFPKLYHFPRNILKAKKEIESVKLQNPNFLSPYELMNCQDIPALCYFSFLIYFKNIKTLRPWSNHFIDQCFNKALIENLKNSEVSKILYYISAQKIAKLKNVEKVILWYENQTIDKCIIKGLRENKKIEIYGCQFFLSLPQQMNLFPSLFEVQNNICPDKIFSTQAIPAFSHMPSKYFQGVALRYLYLKKYSLNEPLPFMKNHFSLFLTFVENKNNYMLQTLSDAGIQSTKIHVKSHPALSSAIIPQNENWIKEDRAQEEILLECEIVFSADSGIIFEAMALARQVIILGPRDSASHFIPPARYRGKLWLLVTQSDDILPSIAALRSFREEHSSEFLNLARSIRADYFNSSEDNILEVLNIK